MTRDEKVKYLSLLIHQYRMARDSEAEEPDKKKKSILSKKVNDAFKDIAEWSKSIDSLED